MSRICDFENKICKLLYISKLQRKCEKMHFICGIICVYGKNVVPLQRNSKRDYITYKNNKQKPKAIMAHIGFLDKNNNYFYINARCIIDHRNDHRMDYFRIYDSRDRQLKYPSNWITPATAEQAILVGFGEFMANRYKPYKFRMYQAETDFWVLLTKQQFNTINDAFKTCNINDEKYDGMTPNEAFLLKSMGLRAGDKKHIEHVSEYIYKIGNTEFIIADRSKLHNIVYDIVKEHALEHIQNAPNLRECIMRHQNPIELIQGLVWCSYAKLIAEEGEKVLVLINY